jgi:ribonuclease P/MRP protein subunit RPP1
MPTEANNFFLMPCIDGCVFPYPSGLHSVSRCISELKSLGFSGMVACGSSEKVIANSDFLLIPGEYFENPKQREVKKQILISNKEGNICLVRAGDSTTNRSLLTTPGVNVLCDLYLAPKQAFDRVCASIAAERNIAIDIRISPLLDQRGTPRERVIRLYEEILTLQNRYEFPIIISSGATNPLEMRSSRAIEALLSEIGMERNRIHSAFSLIPELIKEKGPVKEV